MVRVISTTYVCCAQLKVVGVKSLNVIRHDCYMDFWKVAKIQWHLERRAA
jgi:hypothetical protein